MQSGRHAPTPCVEHRLGAFYPLFSCSAPTRHLHCRPPSHETPRQAAAGSNWADDAGNARPGGCRKGAREGISGCCSGACLDPAACGRKAGKGAQRQGRALPLVMRTTVGIAKSAALPYPGEGRAAEAVRGLRRRRYGSAQRQRTCRLLARKVGRKRGTGTLRFPDAVPR